MYTNIPVVVTLLKLFLCLDKTFLQSCLKRYSVQYFTLFI